MSDRELLELAAKAMGWSIPDDYRWNVERGCFMYVRHGCSIRQDWNPLEDDGDALRLAVNLGIDWQHDGFTSRHVVAVADDCCYEEPYGEDKCAALRRAIVRAAAGGAPNMPTKEVP